MQTLVSGNNKGFTLLEVLLVLIMAGLLMGVLATSLTEGPVLRKAARELSTSLRHARAQAVMRQQQVVWKLEIDGLDKDKPNHFWIEGPNHSKDSDMALHEGMTAKLNTTSSEVESKTTGGIRFYPDGSSTGGSIELSYQQQAYKVNVEWVTGRVSIQ